MLQSEIEDMAVLEQWLSEKRGRRVNIKVPKQGREALFEKQKEKKKQSGNDAGGRVSLDGSPDDRAGSKGKGRRRRQVGRKLRTCDTGCDQENGKEAWDGAHICNYYF